MFFKLAKTFFQLSAIGGAVVNFEIFVTNNQLKNKSLYYYLFTFGRALKKFILTLLLAVVAVVARARNVVVNFFWCLLFLR